MLSAFVSHSLLKVRLRIAQRTGSVAYVPEHGYLYINPRPMSRRDIITRMGTKNGGLFVRRFVVPKGRFELPRGCPHYALNVARLPVPPLRHGSLPRYGADRRTRTGDLLFTKQLLYQLS